MKKVIKLILWILWMMVIFFLSSHNAELSANTSNGLTNHLYNIYAFIFADKIKYTQDVFIETYAPILRIFAHFIEYLILAILTLINLDKYDYRKRILLTILFCIIFAISDEIHQLYVKDRYCSLIDIIINSSGSLTGIFLYHLLKR